MQVVEVTNCTCPQILDIIVVYNTVQNSFAPWKLFSKAQGTTKMKFCWWNYRCQDINLCYRLVYIYERVNSLHFSIWHTSCQFWHSCCFRLRLHYVILYFSRRLGNHNGKELAYSLFINLTFKKYYYNFKVKRCAVIDGINNRTMTMSYIVKCFQETSKNAYTQTCLSTLNQNLRGYNMKAWERIQCR